MHHSKVSIKLEKFVLFTDKLVDFLMSDLNFPFGLADRESKLTDDQGQQENQSHQSNS